MTPTGSVLRVMGKKRSCGWSACWARGVWAGAVDTTVKTTSAERTERSIWPPSAAPVLPDAIVEARDPAFRSATARTGSRMISWGRGFLDRQPWPHDFPRDGNQRRNQKPRGAAVGYAVVGILAPLPVVRAAPNVSR